jgi:large subunit ribosomal protein L6
MSTETTSNEIRVRTSRIGKRPIELPKGVTLTLQETPAGSVAEVKGPKGTLSRPLPRGAVIKVEGNQVAVSTNTRPEQAACVQGTARAHLANMVKGVSEGYTKTLELVGTGYRAELKGTVLHLALGLSHPVVYPLPASIKAQIPADSKGTLIILTGPDKDEMGQTAATLRSFRPPEPYGGKGVRYKDENIRRKAGKASAKGKGGKGGKLGRTMTKLEGRDRRKLRIRKKITGTSERPRLSVFRSAKHIYAQVIDDTTGQTLAHASTLSEGIKSELGESNKTEAARMVGRHIARLCREKNITKVVFDRNGYMYHGRVVALAEGAREGELDF